jgi:hypothetical protein
MECPIDRSLGLMEHCWNEPKFALAQVPSDLSGLVRKIAGRQV